MPTAVAKLAAVRRRKRATTGQKVEGRKSHAKACELGLEGIVSKREGSLF
jgi:hypothetical protein